MNKNNSIPVICIDGPTASGKGTLSAMLANKMGYHLLDSGALYRITALAAMWNNVKINLLNEDVIVSIIGRISIEFKENKTFLNGIDVTAAIRTEEMGMDASTVSGFPKVRLALTDLQRSFCKLPGLVADGRDMGTVIFPDAKLKVFLTASAEKRAERRHAQLTTSGFVVSLDTIQTTLKARDEQDTSRAVAPLKAARDAFLLDNSCLNPTQSIEVVMNWLDEKTKV